MAKGLLVSRAVLLATEPSAPVEVEKWVPDPPINQPSGRPSAAHRPSKEHGRGAAPALTEACGAR